MSRLEDLLQTLCPDGVEKLRLSKICEIRRGQRITKSELIPEGPFPVISGGINPMGFTTDFNRNENTITVAQYGTAGFVNWQTKKFWANDVCYSIYPNKELLNKYLYYFLLSTQDIIYTLVIDAVPAHLPQSRLAALEILVPPLPVQEEIVRILDTFSGVVTELEAEHAARVRQYEHYRNELLSFDSGSKIVENLFADFGLDSVEFTNLGEVVDILDSQRKPVTKSQRKPGPFPYYGANGIQDYVAGYIFDGTFLLLGEDGSVINPDGSPILTWATGKIWVNNHAHILAEKNNGALLRYLYYYLQTVDVSKVVRGVPPKINQENLRKIRVALPPREVQEQIVSILDRFDTLVNDLKSGLPAEIALRRKQYEYYRDKLLTFPAKQPPL